MCLVGIARQTCYFTVGSKLLPPSTLKYIKFQVLLFFIIPFENAFWIRSEVDDLQRKAFVKNAVRAASNVRRKTMETAMLSEQLYEERATFFREFLDQDVTFVCIISMNNVLQVWRGRTSK